MIYDYFSRLLLVKLHELICERSIAFLWQTAESITFAKDKVYPLGICMIDAN